MSSIFGARKNISGLVNVEVTSPAWLMDFFVNVEPWGNGTVFGSDRNRLGYFL